MEKEIENLLGLEFKIDNVENSSMENGEDAFIIYLKVDNRTSKSRKINLLKATYVTSKREQLEQDIWLSGYITGEDTLKSNSFKKAGLIFYKSKLKRVVENDILYVTIELVKEGTELTLCFQKTGTNWIIVNKEKVDVEIKLTPKQLEKNLLKRIERLEAFEERLDINFEKLSIKVDNDDSLWFSLLGELHANSGTELKESLDVVCVLYDNQDGIIEQSSEYFGSDDFFGFEVFEFRFQEDGIAEQVSKIRIYPKK